VTRRFFLVALLAAAIAAAPARVAAPAGAPATLRVFAAASLAGAFGDIAKDFERSHAGLRVQLNLAGSQQLSAQIEQGARADVFASADDAWMNHLVEAGKIQGPPARFARNRLVVIVPRTNPGRIARLQDLARRGIKLVIGAEAVPVGRYGREMLRNLGSAPGFSSDFTRLALANVVSEEENVKAVVGKVQLGEADAGICYRSDVTAAVARLVRVLEIPESANVLASYPIAVVAEAPRPNAAREFVARVLSAEGQRMLERNGLIPGAAATP